MWLEDLRRRWTEALAHLGSCPRCGGDRVWRNGIRWRKATVLDGDRVVYIGDVPVRRLRCRGCGARWSRAPEQIESRGHYQPGVVARAVTRVVVEGGPSAVAREHGCARRTLGRWVERVASAAEPARLSRVLLAAADQPVLPALPTTRTSRSTRLTTLGARAIAVLALLEALASLHGLAPPGLAHARVFVPADAAPEAKKGGAPSVRERTTIQPRRRRCTRRGIVPLSGDLTTARRARGWIPARAHHHACARATPASASRRDRDLWPHVVGVAQPVPAR